MSQPAASRLPLRLAYLSPLPPARSGVADYSCELLPHLARLARVTVYAGEQARLPSADFVRRPLSSFPAERWQHHLALYHMGNSVHHAPIYPLLLRYPGVVVLHDYGLHHFIADTTVGRGDFNAFARELSYARGAAGTALAWAIREGRQLHPLFELPLNDRLLDRSLGLIVHSRYVADQLRATHPARPLRVIPALVEPRPAPARRHLLNLPPDTLLFASAGLVTATKQPELMLRAFARLRQARPNIHFLFIGEAHSDVDLPALIGRLGLEGAVTLTGFVADLDDFVGWLAAADVVVNLRHPTVGETSATALRALAAARPIVVHDHGWYAELPDEVAVKIGPQDEDALLAALARLAESPPQRDALGRQGLAYVRAHHDPAAVAEQYFDFLDEILFQSLARLPAPLRSQEPAGA